jgi:putative heme degradation protein
MLVFGRRGTWRQVSLVWRASYSSNITTHQLASLRALQYFDGMGEAIVKVVAKEARWSLGSIFMATSRYGSPWDVTKATEG